MEEWNMPLERQQVLQMFAHFCKQNNLDATALLQIAEVCVRQVMCKGCIDPEEGREIATKLMEMQ